MENNNSDKAFWSQRYHERDTGWDIGHLSPPIGAYIDQLEDKSIHILIPGAGNAYEAEYLFNKGFKNVWVIDLAPQPLKNLKNRVLSFPADQIIEGNFFELKMKFDLIIEQTFFCALHPSLRTSYVKKCFELLNPGGKLIGLLFNIPQNENRPPYGGNIAEYQSLFKKLFDIRIMEIAHNSIKPREGNELFINFVKKEH